MLFLFPFENIFQENRPAQKYGDGLKIDMSFKPGRTKLYSLDRTKFMTAVTLNAG
jgi:hypothetical protein